MCVFMLLFAPELLGISKDYFCDRVQSGETRMDCVVTQRFLKAIPLLEKLTLVRLMGINRDS
jgi:hypothetical protein